MFLNKDLQTIGRANGFNFSPKVPRRSDLIDRLASVAALAAI